MNLIFKPTGETVTVLPWVAQTPRPWGEHYERVARYLPCGLREFIIAKTKLGVPRRHHYGLGDYR